MEIKLLLKWQISAVRHLKVPRIALFVTWPISTCDSSSLFRISH